MKTCRVCLHPKRSEVDAALLAGEPYRTVSDRFGPSKTALLRHREHVPAALAEARQAERVADADSLLDKVRGLEADARRIGAAAEKAGDARTALAAVRELIRIVDLLGRLRGELDGQGVTVKVKSGPRGPFVVEFTEGPHMDLLCLACREKVKHACLDAADVHPLILLPALKDDA